MRRAHPAVTEGIERLLAEFAASEADETVVAVLGALMGAASAAAEQKRAAASPDTSVAGHPIAEAIRAADVDALTAAIVGDGQGGAAADAVRRARLTQPIGAFTPLQMACGALRSDHACSIAVVRALVTLGADVDATPPPPPPAAPGHATHKAVGLEAAASRMAPLVMAMRCTAAGSDEVTRFLILEAGADYLRLHEDGRAAADVAVDFEHENAFCWMWMHAQSVGPAQLRRLCNHRVVSAAVPLGKPLLAYAAESPNPLYATLIALHADLDTRDEAGSSCMVDALTGHPTRFEPMVRVMLSRGADPDQRDAEGRTALHHAARQGITAFCSFLLEHGAAVGVRDKYGESALDCAHRYRHPITVALLERHAARRKAHPGRAVVRPRPAAEAADASPVDGLAEPAADAPVKMESKGEAGASAGDGVGSDEAGATMAPESRAAPAAAAAGAGASSSSSGAPTTAVRRERSESLDRFARACRDVIQVVHNFGMEPALDGADHTRLVELCAAARYALPVIARLRKTAASAPPSV